MKFLLLADGEVINTLCFVDINTFFVTENVDF